MAGWLAGWPPVDAGGGMQGVRSTPVFGKVGKNVRLILLHFYAKISDSLAHEARRKINGKTVVKRTRTKERVHGQRG